MLLLLASLVASATPDTLTWDMSFAGQSVGSRTVTVRTENTRIGELRIIQADTHIKAGFVGMQFEWRQRLTANADVGPSSFISVTKNGGEISEIQGRRAATGWIVSTNREGHEKWDEFDADAIDLSTADLMDPGTTVPLARFEKARVLSTETGQILTGTVEPIGPSDIAIKGKNVPVDGYTWTTDEGTARFFYTSEGYLVRFETRLMGKVIQGTLREPPPLGADEQPVVLGGQGIEEVEL